MKKLSLIILLGFVTNFLAAQESDTNAYTLYKDHLILSSDFGFSSSPFSIKYNFPNGLKRIYFKHNLKPTLGFGVNYKWISFRLRFGLPGHFRPLGRFGESDYIDFGLNFNTKRMYWDIDFRNYKGYVIMNADQWNDEYNELNPNQFRPNTQLSNLSLQAWYFNSKSFKMPAVLGKVGHYNKEVRTFYIKSSLGIYGVSNQVDPILPDELIDSTDTKSMANIINALDIGVVPGYAYVNRINNWQFSAFGGIGGVIQAKFYSSQSISRGFLGLAPRFDLRFAGGYSQPAYFCFLVSDFDIKSIHHNALKFNQSYYKLQLVFGFRFEKNNTEKNNS